MPLPSGMVGRSLGRHRSERQSARLPTKALDLPSAEPSRSYPRCARETFARQAGRHQLVSRSETKESPAFQNVLAGTSPAVMRARNTRCDYRRNFGEGRDATASRLSFSLVLIKNVRLRCRQRWVEGCLPPCSRIRAFTRDCRVCPFHPPHNAVYRQG